MPNDHQGLNLLELQYFHKKLAKLFKAEIVKHPDSFYANRPNYCPNIMVSLRNIEFLKL
jgi:hypothetical protein